MCACMRFSSLYWGVLHASHSYVVMEHFCSNYRLTWFKKKLSHFGLRMHNLVETQLPLLHPTTKVCIVHIQPIFSGMKQFVH